MLIKTCYTDRLNHYFDWNCCEVTSVFWAREQCNRSVNSQGNTGVVVVVVEGGGVVSAHDLWSSVQPVLLARRDTHLQCVSSILSWSEPWAAALQYSAKVKPDTIGFPNFVKVASGKTQWSHTNPVFTICLCAGVPFVNSPDTIEQKPTRRTRVALMRGFRKWVGGYQKPWRIKRQLLVKPRGASTGAPQGCALPPPWHVCALELLHRDFSFL